MDDAVDKLTALVTIEPWSEPGPAGYLVRVLVRRGDATRDVVGPFLVTSREQLHRELIGVCETLMRMV